jgi:hypothetical protein
LKKSDENGKQRAQCPRGENKEEEGERQTGIT